MICRSISKKTAQIRACARAAPPSQTARYFGLSDIEPGVIPRNHRTDSIDYAVVMSGEIDMEMDDTVVHLKAGMCSCNGPQFTIG